VLYDAMQILGGGSILGGLVLGAIAVFIIEREFMKAAGFAMAGAAMTFFGFMHGEQIGIAQTPTVAVSYLIVAGILAVAPGTRRYQRNLPWNPKRSTARAFLLRSIRGCAVKFDFMENDPQQVLRLNDLFQISNWQHTLPWKPFREGVDIYRLYGGPDSGNDGGPSAALLRYHPGSRVGLHEHVGYEHILVCRIAGRREQQIGDRNIDRQSAGYASQRPD